MARWQLFIRRPSSTTALKVWDGDVAADTFDFEGTLRTYDAALGFALRSASDCVLRDSTSTDPSARSVVLFTRGVGDYP